MRRAVGGVFAATLPGVAGCLSASGDDGGPGKMDHASWLYPPGSVGPSPHNAFYALDLARVRSLEDAFRQPTYAKYAGYVDHPGLDVLARTSVRIDGVLQVFPLGAAPLQGAVIAAGNGREELRAAFRRALGGRRAYRGFDLYPDAGPEVAVAVGDGRVLVGHPSETHAPADVVRAMIDARAGAADRYGEVSADFERLASGLGRGHDVSGFTHPPRTDASPARGVFENAVAKGHRYIFEPDTSRSRYVFVFGSRDDVDLAAVREWIDENDGAGDRLFGAYDGVEVTRGGRCAIVDGTLPTGAI